MQFYTVSFCHYILFDTDPYSDSDPLRQKVPDPTGSGSITLVFKQKVLTLLYLCIKKWALTGTSNPDGVPD